MREPSDANKHTSGIIDGATCFLRNVKHGTYLDVDDVKTASGTTVSTYPFHSGINQKFVFKYLGMDLFEIEPSYTPGIILNIDSNSEAARLSIKIKNRTTTNQKFRVHVLSPNKVILYTEISGSDRAICFNKSSPNDVVQRNYENLSSADKGYAEWILERSGSSYDSYYKYFIKNQNTGTYLDVVEKGTTNGAIVHARSLLGVNNQQFKKVEIGNKCAFKPMHRTDMAIDVYKTVSEGKLVIYDDGYSSDQNFEMELVTGNIYRIKITRPNTPPYLNLGAPMPGSNSNMFYVTCGSSSNDLWVLVKALY